MEHLANNVKRFRLAKRWTQVELASRAGVPRATCADVERGNANPSLATVVAVAAALGVSVDELLRAGTHRRWFKSTPQTSEEYRADAGRYRSLTVSPITSKGVHMHIVQLAPGCRSVGRPHPEGAQEFFCCLDGVAMVQIDDETVTVEAGSLVQFPGHLRHVYLNRGTVAARAVSTVVMHLQ